MADGEQGGSTPVRQAIGDNIKRVRELRGMTVRELSARLKGLGFALSASGVSEVEHASRKIGADELLVFAIALNTSVIDLLAPERGAMLRVADGIDPMHWRWLSAWLAGEHPAVRYWGPDKQADWEQFLQAASDGRKAHMAVTGRPDLTAIERLYGLAEDAIENMGYIFDPPPVAGNLRAQLSRVEAFINLLADDIEQNGNSKRRDLEAGDGG